MTTILFISSALNRAGTETFMMNVFRSLPQDKYWVDFLIFTDADTDYTHEVETSDHRVWRLVSRRNGKLTYFTQLKKFFCEHASEYHAIHWCGNSLSSMASIYYAWKYNVPIRIVHAHNSSASGLHNRMLHRLFRHFVSCITTHHLACSSAAAKWFFGDAKDTIILKNGIDLDKYTYNETVRTTTRKQLGFLEDTLVIGHIGRFCTEKNHTFLLQIFSRLLKIHPNAILMSVGKGELEQEIKELAEKLSISSNVMFLGERSDVPNLLNAIDCFVLPSTFEGQPFVLIEAQAAGLPCIVSDVVNKDIAISPNVFFLSLNHDSMIWARKIREISVHFARTNTAQYIKEAGYSVKDTINQLASIYGS